MAATANQHYPTQHKVAMAESVLQVLGCGSSRELVTTYTLSVTGLTETLWTQFMRGSGQYASFFQLL